MTATHSDPPVRIGSATALRATRSPEGPRPVQKQGAARYFKEMSLLNLLENRNQLRKVLDVGVIHSDQEQGEY